MTESEVNFLIGRLLIYGVRSLDFPDMPKNLKLPKSIKEITLYANRG